MTFQTIDFDNMTKDEFERLYLKLARCKHYIKLRVNLSARMNGYHVEYLCDYPENTCPCRFCLDDQNRFHFDAKRLKHRQNIIFTEKAVRRRGIVEMRLKIDSER